MEHALIPVAPGQPPSKKLKPNEFRLLVHMAFTALDTSAVPTYFGSRELSAYGLGWAITPTSTERERASKFQMVLLATAGLVSAGAIRRVGRGREGARARFVLEFAHNTPVVKANRGNDQLTLDNNSSLTLDTNSSLTLEVNDELAESTRIVNPYRNQDEPQKNLGEEITLDSGPAHVRPVDNFKAAWTDPARSTADRRTGEVSDDWEPATVESSAA